MLNYLTPSIEKRKGKKEIKKQNRAIVTHCKQIIILKYFSGKCVRVGHAKGSDFGMGLFTLLPGFPPRAGLTSLLRDVVKRSLLAIRLPIRVAPELVKP